MATPSEVSLMAQVEGLGEQWFQMGHACAKAQCLAALRDMLEGDPAAMVVVIGALDSVEAPPSNRAVAVLAALRRTPVHA